MSSAALTDEEWAVRLLLDESEHACAFCGEDIHSVEETRLVQVVYATSDPSSFCIIENDEGEFQYKPYFFHFICWEDVQESLEEIVGDREPVLRDESRAVLECNGCASDIYAWDTVGLISFGEFRRPHRRPNNESTFIFDECNSTPHILCLSCLNAVNHEVIEMWSEQ